MLYKYFMAFSLAIIAAVSPVSASIAPGVSSVRVVQVQSETGGSETIAAGATSTTYSHGGSYLQVTVDEFGISTYREATYIKTVPSSAITSTRPICGSARAPSICGAYDDVIGYEVVYKFNPLELSGNSTWSSNYFKYYARGNGGEASTSFLIRA